MSWWKSSQSQTPTPLGLPNNQQTLPAQNGFAPHGGYNPAMAGFGGGIMSGMGYQYQPPTQFAPPSDLEVMAALIQTSAPVDRWYAGPNLQIFTQMMYKISAVAMIDILKNVNLVETDDGKLSFEFIDQSILPTNDGVVMEMNSLQAAATMARDNAHQQQQAILNMMQHNLMSDALGAAIANPSFMQNVGSTIGNVFRGAIGMPPSASVPPPVGV